MTGLDLLEQVQRMDPTRMALTQTQRDTLVEAIQEIAAAEGISARQISRILGCSTSVWSQVRHGKYSGNTDRYLTRGRRWLQDRDSAAPACDTAFVPTSEAKLILAACRRAVNMPCIGKVSLESGSGKTAALREFVRRRPGRTVYIQAGEAATSKRAFLRVLCRKLLIKAPKWAAMGELYEELRQHLADTYAGGANSPLCVLVDEATTLAPAVLNLLRNLHDDADCGVAVVLADTRRIEAALHGRKMAGGFEQLRSRFGAVYAPPADRKVKLDDVRRVAESVVKALGCKRKLHADTVKYLHGLAEKPGRYRNVVYRLRTVHDVAEAYGKSPRYSVAELDFVADLVGGERQIHHGGSPFAAGKVSQDAARRQAS